ncbi:XdhC family protein, partial [Streptomyces mirabilis]|uniref:XdhC family protein n=1 Tax=Streptomyces mirabilis TaxID=68239 RepID=UPI00367B39D1
MLDIADQLSRWCEQGRTFAVATVVAVHGGAPRQPGAALGVGGDGGGLGGGVGCGGGGGGARERRGL